MKLLFWAQIAAGFYLMTEVITLWLGLRRREKERRRALEVDPSRREDR